MALSFHHISVFSLHRGPGGGRRVMEFSSRRSRPEFPPRVGDSSNRKTVNQRKEPKKKSVNVRKEFPETWLWTEEMVK